MLRICLCLAVLPLAPATAAWKAGAAKVSITPRSSLWMAGFGDRRHPSEGVGLDLFARALALEDSAGRRSVIVATDMLGFPADVSRVVSERIAARYRIPRDRLLLNSSHTHCGPVIGRMLEGAYDLTPRQWADIDAYTRELEDKVVAVVGEALRNLAPAGLSFGQTNASFGVNRRLDAGRKWGPNYAGTADHDVPILRVEGEHGDLRAVVFGFGCHPSTLPPSYYKFHGDYAGVTEKCLEDQHAGAVALFVMGAGGDVKPFPCDTLALAEKYGELLAATVEHQLESTMAPVEGPLSSAFATVPLAFDTPPTREQFETVLKSDNPAERRHAAHMLAVIDRDGHLSKDYPEPLQAWQFGRDLTLVAMGGEVVSDYSLRLKKEFDGTRLWVAGYSNDVFAYIPSLRVLKEGGYEGGGAMIYYMQPGPWAPTVEETVVAKIRELIRRVQAQ